MLPSIKSLGLWANLRLTTFIVTVIGCSTFVVAQDNTKIINYDVVKPILTKRCGSCHGRGNPESGLDLSNMVGVKAGSESGPVVVAGKPDQSLLYTLAAHIEEPIMPPGKERIPEEELAIIREWIEGGLLDSGATAETTGMNSSLPKSVNLIEPVRPALQRTAITALAIHPAGDLLAVSGVDQVILIDTKTKQPIKAFPFPEGKVFDLKFSKDGKNLLIAGGKGAASGLAILVEVSTGERKLSTPEEFDSILTIDMTPDEEFLAWGGPWRSVKAMHTRNPQTIAEFTGPTDWILSTSLSPDGRLVAGADRFGGLRIWSMSSGKEFWNLRGHTGAVTKTVWANDGDALLSIGIDKTCRLWNLHSGETVLNLNLNGGELWAADMHLANMIAVGGRDKKVIVMDLSGNKLGEFPMPDEITEIAFAPNGESVFAADAGGTIAQFEISKPDSNIRYDLPLAEATAKLELPWPARARPVPPPVEKVLNVANSPEASIEAALLQTEEAIKSTEASLQAMKDSAERLRESLKALQANK